MPQTCVLKGAPATPAPKEVSWFASWLLSYRLLREPIKNAAATFTRLVTESCAQQTQAAFKAGGTKALEVPFRTLGQLAMQELMSNRDVSASMSAFDKYIDKDKLNQVLSGK
jgi:hypothetical protein